MVEAVRSQNYRGDIAIDEIGFNKGLCLQQSRNETQASEQSNSETRAP